MSTAEIAARQREMQNPALAANEPVGATLSRQLLSRRQLCEPMVEFWSNHFSVCLQDGPVRTTAT